MPETNGATRVINVLSVDVEDYFHPTEVQGLVQREDWITLPSRVEASTQRVLDLLARFDVRATFFIVGWVAERFPHLVRQIAGAGHELGCHSYAHQLVYDLTPLDFRRDTELCQAIIADACGILPRTYRAPSYSITSSSLWALDILAELGFTHDSSIVPISHDRYGIPGFKRHAHLLNTSSGPLYEVPVATALLPGGRIAPVGGGAYLRILPYRYTAAGLRRINQDEHQPACVYLHPWELDPEQPRLARGLIARTRTYTGLSGMERKLERLLSEFRFAPMCDVHTVPQLSASACVS